MSEPAELVAARKHLSRAETMFRSPVGLQHLEEGIEGLERIATSANTDHHELATNLLATYTSRICRAVKSLVDGDPHLPEPELEHLFKVLLAFDAVEIPMPDYVRSLKVDVVKRLIDHYYEGHSSDEKNELMRRLANIADDHE